MTTALELYVVYEMHDTRDIMIAVFLDQTDAIIFTRSCDMGLRYMVPIEATEQMIRLWYFFRLEADEAIDRDAGIV